MTAHAFIRMFAVIEKLQAAKAAKPAMNKAAAEALLVQVADATKQRSVFACADFALRFSEANTDTFSNVVLSLSALKNYDAKPFLVCIVRPTGLDFRLANTTFLKRISHSSHKLTVENVRGSFLGHDIANDYKDIPNSSENFERLFALHSAFSWNENLERLVASTNAIAARSTRYLLTPEKLKTILEAPSRAKEALAHPNAIVAAKTLNDRVLANIGDLLAAAELDNVNIRGNEIEQIVTGALNAHGLDDLTFDLPNGRLVIDIKTKLLDRASAPKAYNIDKLLHLLAMAGSVFEFFFIGIHAERKIVKTALVSIFDPAIVRATRIQTHWAGRNSRGVTQLTGDITEIFEPNYETSVDEQSAIALLRRFAER